MYSSLVRFHKCNEYQNKILDSDTMLISGDYSIENILYMLNHYLLTQNDRDIIEFKDFLAINYKKYDVFINVSSYVYYQYQLINHVDIYINEYGNFCNFDVKLQTVFSTRSLSILHKKLKFQIITDVINKTDVFDNIDLYPIIS